MDYQYIIVDEQDEVGIITLNRPQVGNALNSAMMNEINQQLEKFDNNKNIGAIIITGSENIFAAGADVKEMYEKQFDTVISEDFLGKWQNITKVKKPVIAAVAGYALGGGCELAMMCDFIIAANNAKFGQPEINLGIMPGIGGTQMLTRVIGKAKTMEMCMTGKIITAQEAEKCGIVSRIVPLEKLLKETLETADKITKMPRTAIMSIKQAVNCAYQTNLEQGISFERKAFYSLFATKDKNEGMKAFIEKREPNFNKQ